MTAAPVATTPPPSPAGGAAPLLWRLEAVRGAAAAYVACGHLFRDELARLSPALGVLLAFGQEAVIVFFLLSGYVIHWSVAHKPGLRFGAYLRARALRIYPLLALALLAALLVARARGEDDPRAGWPVLLGNLLMLQDAGFLKPGVWVETYAGVLALWSLSYEWWFYLLYFPLSRKVPAGAQARVAATISLSQLPVYLLWPNQVSRFLLYFCIWWAGVELARLRLAGRPPGLRTLAVPLGAVAAVALALGWGVWRARAAGAALSPGTHPVLELRHFAAALLAVGAALLWRRARWFGFRPLLGGFVWVAPWSYALYLLHEPLGVRLRWPGLAAWPLAQAAVGAALAVAAAWLAERHVQGWCRRRFAR